MVVPPLLDPGTELGHGPVCPGNIPGEYGEDCLRKARYVRQRPDLVAGLLNGLHPAELAWIVEKAGGPDWFLAAAAAVPVPEDEDDGVVRLRHATSDVESRGPWHRPGR